MPHLRLSVSLLLLSSLVAPASAQGHPFRFAREDVLGTSAELMVDASDEATAQRAEAAVFAEVQRLAAIVSTWDEHAELARLVAAGKGSPSSDLAAILHLADDWRTRSNGAFEPGTARLASLWTAATKNGQAPEAAALAAAAADLRTPSWHFTGNDVTVRGPITLDAIAKGWIVERASAATASAGATLVSFQIGGDTRIGKAPHEVAIADPRAPASNGTPLRTVRIAEAAVASSGSYARGFDLSGTHHSHILDPRSGQPSDGVLGASVVAKDVATADVLATILCVLGPEDGLALLATVPGAEAILVTADGMAHESKGFAALTVAAKAPANATAKAPTSRDGGWPPDYALRVDFEIKAPATTGSSRRGGWKRPYVAVWIEDAIGEPARTLCLWIEDRRWLRDLRRWSKKYDGGDHIADVVSQATRKAGAYTLTWDGKDDDGRQLAPGRYTVCIEAAREHGTYQLIRHEIELGTTASQVDLEANDEIATARLTFGPAPRSTSK